MNDRFARAADYWMTYAPVRGRVDVLVDLLVQNDEALGHAMVEAPNMPEDSLSYRTRSRDDWIELIRNEMQARFAAQSRRFADAIKYGADALAAMQQGDSAGEPPPGSTQTVADVALGAIAATKGGMPLGDALGWTRRLLHMLMTLSLATAALNDETGSMAQGYAAEWPKRLKSAVGQYLGTVASAFPAYPAPPPSVRVYETAELAGKNREREWRERFQPVWFTFLERHAIRIRGQAHAEAGASADDHNHNHGAGRHDQALIALDVVDEPLGHQRHGAARNQTWFARWWAWKALLKDLVRLVEKMDPPDDKWARQLQEVFPGHPEPGHPCRLSAGPECAVWMHLFTLGEPEYAGHLADVGAQPRAPFVFDTKSGGVRVAPLLAAEAAEEYPDQITVKPHRLAYL